MKKNTFSYTILYYDIIPILLFGIALIIFKDHLLEEICSVTQVREQSRNYRLYECAVDWGLLGLWIYITFTSIRDKRYKELTGRFYRKDHSEFKKTYATLVRFFTTNDPYKMNVEELPIADWHSSEGVILCKIKDRTGTYRLVKRASNANGNLVSFGLPGSGKSTTQAATTAARFNADLVDGGCGVFAISIKGDLLNFVRDKRKIGRAHV